MSSSLIMFTMAPISFLIFAVSNTPTPPPDLTGLAAIITAVIGVVGFFATIYRGRQNNKRVGEIEDAASYVKGFDSLTKRLREEMQDMREEHKQERAQWSNERGNLEEAISKIRVELNQQISENYKVRGELSELHGQIRGFLNTEDYNEFKKHSSRDSRS